MLDYGRPFALMMFVLQVWACSSNDSGKQLGNVEKEVTAKAEKKVNAEVPDIISIYLYAGFPVQKAKTLERNLKAFFPKVVLERECIPLPPKEYHKQCNRYRAEGLSNDLLKYRKGDVPLGLTDKIIYHPNKKSPTWGVMGLSPVGGYRCVISSRMAKNGREQTDENFCKLALHELGHAFGLPHCADQHCFMVDAGGTTKFPQTHGFCSSCKVKLNAKGWRIK